MVPPTGFEPMMPGWKPGDLDHLSKGAGCGGESRTHFMTAYEAAQPSEACLRKETQDTMNAHHLSYIPIWNAGVEPTL